MGDVVSQDPSTRTRSRQPHPGVVLSLTALLLTVAFLSAVSYWRTPLSVTEKPTCPAVVSPVATSGSVTVNVYNATNRAGLAAATARLVREHGFVVTAVQNDPAGKPVPQPALVRFGPNGEAGAQLILALVSGAVPEQDGRADGSVDLVLGDAFTALASLPPTAPTASPC